MGARSLLYRKLRCNGLAASAVTGHDHRAGDREQLTE
jgi:hypothetical protein